MYMYVLCVFIYTHSHRQDYLKYICVCVPIAVLFAYNYVICYSKSNFEKYKSQLFRKRFNYTFFELT